MDEYRRKRKQEEPKHPKTSGSRNSERRRKYKTGLSSSAQVSFAIYAEPPLTVLVSLGIHITRHLDARKRISIEVEDGDGTAPQLVTPTECILVH